MSRYKKVFNAQSATDTIKPVGKIKERETDLYITYNAADRLDMISYRVYDDPQYWWVILAANGYQLEFDIEDGEILRIPAPLSDVLADIRKNLNG